MEAGMSESFDFYLQEISQFPLLSKQREKDLAVLIMQNKNRAAADELFNCNLRFVVSRARHYPVEHISIQDLVAEGNIGLWRAVWKYNPWHRYQETGETIRFSTCARWWIDQSILRFMQTYGRFVNYPAQIGSEVGKILRMYREQLSEGQIDIEAIAKRCKMHESDILNIILLNMRVGSLDMPINEDGDNLQDIIPDNLQVVTQPSPLLEEALACLTEYERFVLLLDFGFYGKDFKQQEIAILLNKPSYQIRKIKSRAIEKLQGHPIWKRLHLTS